jgi:anti-sigma factor RsiW
VIAMSKCRDLDPLFAPYADGEVAADDRASLEAHLERCPPCRERVAEQRTVRAVLVARRPTLRACASDHLRARCAASARHSTRGPFPFLAGGAARRWVPLSLAATLLLAVAGAFVFGLNDTVEALAAQLTLDHVTCFQLAPERLAHTDSATASREWTARQGWAIQIPASSASAGLELLGVRRCSMSSGRVAHVMYKWRGEPLSVFVVPRTLRPMRQRQEPGGQPQEIVEKFGHEAIIWTEGDRTYVILARAQPADLQPVVGYVRANAR